jgi:glycosyltransferase involved in cell wall biosynthesis
MRALFIALAVPYPPNNGQRLRNFGILKALASEGCEVTLLSFAGPAEMNQQALAAQGFCREVQLVPTPSRGSSRLTSLWGRARSLLSPHPYGVLRYRSREMEKAVRAMLNKRDFDAVFCDDVYQFANLPESVLDKVLLNKHDFTFVVYERLLGGVSNPLARAYARLETRKVRKWEFDVSSRVARVLVCSEQDGQLLRSVVPDDKIFVVPNAIDVEAYTPRRLDDGRTLLFFGAMDYHANQDAVEYFVTSILPLVKETTPDIKFIVAGRNPPEWLRAKYAQTPDVEFTGTVPDMSLELAKATVCVVPLRVGSGTRLKILEAAAMGKAIVSTRVGAEGLLLHHGGEILLEDEPEAFAKAIRDLLANPSLREELGRAARSKVERHYSFPALRESLRKVLSSLDTRRSVPVGAN